MKDPTLQYPVDFVFLSWFPLWITGMKSKYAQLIPEDLKWENMSPFPNSPLTLNIGQDH